MFGGAKEFCPDVPKLARKILDLQKNKKLFMSIRVPLLSNQSMLVAIFAPIFKEFWKVLRDFARIFTKSKLLEVRFHPCTPASYIMCHQTLCNDIVLQRPFLTATLLRRIFEKPHAQGLSELAPRLAQIYLDTGRTNDCLKITLWKKN